MDSAIAVLHETIPPLKAELKSKSAYLVTLRAAPTTEALREAVTNLGRKKAEMEARLQALKSSNVKAISQEDRERTEEDFRKWKRKSASRRKCWKEAEAVLLEGLTKEELYVSKNLSLSLVDPRVPAKRT
jgi:1,2-phenylacetyl-CoA epoxidase PaaB subunit